jgi:hypothetical protein
VIFFFYPQVVSFVPDIMEFDQTFHFNKDFAYDAKIADQIVANRRALDNQLFVDRLLSLLGVNAGIYFLGTEMDYF